MSLDDESLVAAVRELAAENPDHVYVAPDSVRQNGTVKDCLYVHEVGEIRTGGCLIGQAVIRCGVPLDEVAKWDEAEDSSADDVLPDSISTEVRRWAYAVQGQQDRGATWHNALAHAYEKWGNPLA